MAASCAQVQIDLDSAAMQARGLSGQDVANALAAQNLITPVGTEKIGTFEYAIQLNNAPSVIAELGDLPIKTVNGAMVYIHDVAHVRDGNPPQTNIVHVDGNRSVLMLVLKNGAVSTLAIIDGIKKKLPESSGRCRPISRSRSSAISRFSSRPRSAASSAKASSPRH